ncbi:MAG TPA: hypothetical protein PLR57_00720 [Clostridia bacterium]|nr:hypothetical protein [Clostridia bacterium]
MEVGASDRIVSFCVCLQDDSTQRLLVSCKITSPGEATVLPDGTSMTIGDVQP